MSRRTEQIAELLRSEINNIMIKDFEPPQGCLISVTEVTVAPDLKNATAYLSIIPDNKLGTGLNIMRKFGGHIQRMLNQKLVIRTVPKINWALDERDLKYKKIDEALKTPHN
jgi:ribosome-binding factor A